MKKSILLIIILITVIAVLAGMVNFGDGTANGTAYYNTLKC